MRCRPSGSYHGDLLAGQRPHIIIIILITNVFNEEHALICLTVSHVDPSPTGFVALTSRSGLGWSCAVWAVGAVRFGTVCSLQPNGSGPQGSQPLSWKQPTHKPPSYFSVSECVFCSQDE